MTDSANIAILAGGDSTRMGRDKATLRYRGETLLGRIARRAARVADRVCVAGRDRPDGWPGPDIAFLPDRVPDRGPIEGLRRALQHIGSPTALVACDMPLITAEALSWLLSTHRDWHADRDRAARRHGLVTFRGDRPEPLFSVYHPSLLDLIDRRIDENRYSLRGLIEEGDLDTRTVPERFADRLRNVNTPEDLEGLP